MGHRLPDDTTPDPDTTPPPFVLLIFTGIVICPDLQCQILPELLLPFAMRLPQAYAGATFYTADHAGFTAWYDGNYPSSDQTYVSLDPTASGGYDSIFQKFSAPWHPWATSLPNHLTTCDHLHCGHSGHVVCFHDFAATQAAQLLGIPPSPTRFWEPFIAGDGSPVYRFADRTLGINILQKTEL